MPAHVRCRVLGANVHVKINSSPDKSAALIFVEHFIDMTT